MRRLFIVILIVWGVIWTVLPGWMNCNVPIDFPELVEWGRHWNSGYDKNPYFCAWLGYTAWKIFPSDWVSYLLSQLFAVLSLVSIWILAGKMFHDPFHRFVAAVIPLLTLYYFWGAVEFNDDVIELGLWPLFGLLFYRAVRTERLTAWTACGMVAGAAVMTKYLSVLILAPAGLILLFTDEGRKAWRRPGVYIAGAVFSLICLPNLLWLVNHDFIAFRYAAQRSQTAQSGGLLSHLTEPIRIAVHFIKTMLLPFFAIMLFPRGKKGDAGESGFDRLFVRLFFGVPMAAAVFFCLITGRNFMKPWTTPFFAFSGLFLVMLRPPVMNRARMKLFLLLLLTALTAVVLIFVYFRLIKWPLRHWHPVNDTFAGREVAGEVSGRWHELYGRRLPYVVGNRENSCYVSYYSEDHPDCWFMDELSCSPWVTPGDILRHGAVFVADSRKELDTLLKDTGMSHAATAFYETSFRRACCGLVAMFGEPPCDVRVCFTFVPPEEKAATESDAAAY